MAQSFPTSQGTLIIPQSYVSYSVAASNAGLSTTGILMLVGEADAGPDFTAETDLAANLYGPSQLADVQAKYKTGPLVDAFNGAVQASADQQIPGSFNRAILVKTNPSTKASAPLLKFDSSNYGTLEDKSFGKLGNLISFQILADTTEVVPTTGPFAFMLPIASTNISVRVNGGAETPLTLGALETPTSFVSALNGVTGVTATGGADRGVAAGPLVGNLSLTVVSGNKVQIDCSVPFASATSAIGDTMYIAASSVLASVHSANAGSYILTGASASQLLATKLLDVTGAPNALTPPINQGSIAIVAATDLKVFSAVTASLTAANPIAGYGKSLEINQLTSGTGILSYLLWVMTSSTPAVVSFISSAATPQLITSGEEYSVEVTEGRQVDNISDSITAGGTPVLLLGYEGTTATVTITATTLTTAVVGGAGTDLSLTLADFPTIADLAAFIDSFAGYSASPGTAVLGSQPSTSLDEGTFGICSTFANEAGRIKQDAYDLYNNMIADAALTMLAAQAASGLPAPTAAVAFLTGGTRGSTSNATYEAAMTALTMVRANFLVPLFSRDASLDIADGITDPASTYTIASIHALSRTHVLQMSTLKKKRNRQAFLSFRGTFSAAMNTAANLASARCSLNFQDVKDTGTDGNIDQFQPWMGAVKAASMQAAGFYLAIFNKLVNISGELQAAGDFSDQDDDALENALEAGLLPLQAAQTGGFVFVSDQTTYGRDNNFVYNSIQAMYVADTIALTMAMQMQQAFVGQNLADVTASIALNTLEGIMQNLFKLKLITTSDDAPKGFKNAVIRITGPAMTVSLEVKEATSLYFIPINFQISQVVQTASA
jgi:hypothetical protein